MKRFFALILTFVIIVSAMPLEVFAEDGTVLKPLLNVQNSDLPVIDAGKSKKIRLNIRNNGSSAYDVKVTPKFDAPFETNNFTNTISIGDIHGNKTIPVDVDVMTTQDAKPGNYAIPLKFEYFYQYYDDNRSLIKVNETYDTTVYVRVSGKSNAAKLLISKVTTNPEVILPGQDVKLNVIFENKGTMDAHNVNVRLKGLKSDSGFYMGSGSDLKFINSVLGNMTSSVTFDLKASTKISRGTHELELSFEYGEVKDEQKVYLTVGGANSTESNLVMENFEYPTAAIGANKNFELKFDLRNNSDSDAVNVLVKAESSDNQVLPMSTNIIKIPSLKAGEVKSYSFIFSPTDEAITRNYPINVSVEYEDDFNPGEDNKHQINQYIGMNVVAKNDGSSSKAKLIIDQYNFEPQLVRAGENFEMNLSFFNTSSTKTVKNIKIFLTSQAGSGKENDNSSAFTPVDSSNTFYIDSIGPKSKVQKSITMFTIPDAIAKTHTITANFEYEDSDGTEYTGITELIGVPVIQQSKLETGELSYSPGAFVGQSTPVSLEFFNTGKVTLYNMMVKLEGDFQSENGQYYVGNFASGSSEYFEGYVIPNEMGELKGAVVFTYEDSTGQMQEVRKEFSLNVGEMPVMDDMDGDMFPPVDQKPTGIKGLLKSKWTWISLAIILGAGGFVVYKKKKKVKELSLDE